jgi:hypothetical protein
MPHAKRPHTISWHERTQFWMTLQQGPIAPGHYHHPHPMCSSTKGGLAHHPPIPHGPSWKPGSPVADPMEATKLPLLECTARMRWWPESLIKSSSDAGS